MVTGKRLIEEKLPIAQLNELSLREAAYKSKIIIPKIHNMHTWFARRPAGPARVLTLASALDANMRVEDLMQATGMLEALSSKKKKVIYMVRPRRDTVAKLVQQSMGREPSSITVVDPMSGGGSIPLESLRLGFKTIAIEYNPVAYLINRATVEFPAKYADSGLLEETVKAAKEFISKARESLGKYYGGNEIQTYIFARGVKCPVCGGLIPVEGVSPVITKDPSYKNRYLAIEFDKNNKTFNVYTTDKPVQKSLEKRRYYIRCPYCGNYLKLRGPSGNGETGFDRWFREHADLMRSVVEEYKEVDSELEQKVLELHIPLVKQVGNSFVSMWNDESEKERFLMAFRDLSREVLELQDYIPIDPIPEENKWAKPARNKGLTKWYMLFNPRQLLTTAKLSRILAETAEKLSARDGEFGAAVALYLAFALDKMVSYNTIATLWHGARSIIAPTIRGESTLDFRLEYGEALAIYRNIEWAFEVEKIRPGEGLWTGGGVLPVLSFLVNELRGAGLGDRVGVYMGDATRLSSILGPGSVDIINVDPPYFDQVIYSDRSEFFWVILKRSLKPVLDILFGDRVYVPGWNWSDHRVPREREVVAHDKEDSTGRYRRYLGEFVAEAYKVLRDDGVLVLWFTHPTDIAWRTVGEALYRAGFVVSRVWPLKTEMPTRYKGQVNVVAQETSLIIVARKGGRIRLTEVGSDVRRSLIEHPRFNVEVERAVEEARKVAGEAGASPADMMALMLGTALSVTTRFEVPGLGSYDQLFDAAATRVSEAFVSPLIERILGESGPVKLDSGDAKRVVALTRSAMLRDPATRSYVTLWFLSRVDLETGRYKDEPLPLSYDFAQTIAKLLGYDLDKLKDAGLISEGSAGSSKGKGKAYYVALFEALTASKARAPPNVLFRLTPSRGIYLANLALNMTGLPSSRAESILREIQNQGWRRDEVAEAAALAIVLLETARDADLGLRGSEGAGLDKYIGSASSGSMQRELAVRTLLEIIARGGGA